MTASILFETILPLFILVFIGFTASRAKVVKEGWTHVLNQFVYYISLPALIINAFADINITTENAEAILWNVGALTGFSALLFIVLNFLKISTEQKVSIFIASILGNTIYLGVPIYESALSVNPQTSIAIASAILVTGIIASMMAIEYWVVRSRQILAYFRDLLKNPLTISIAIGLGINMFIGLLDISLPVAINGSITLIAATASPVALISLGAFIQGKFNAQHIKASLVSSAIKLLILPVFVWIILINISGVSQEIIVASVVASGMPLAITGFVLADKYELDKTEIANTLFISTVVSLVTLPLLINIL